MAIIDSRYVGSWYFLKTALTNVSGTSYILANSVSNNSDLTTAPKELIQGEAGTLVIDQLGRKETSTVSGDALIIKNASNNYLVDTTTVTYKDVFDLLIDDYYLLLNFFFYSVEDIYNVDDLAWLQYILTQLGLTITNKNLLKSATINIGSNISCTLNYNCRYDTKFTIDLPVTNNNAEDFIARTAKNYDVRFMIDGNNYYIKSGTINISVGYSEVYLANTGYQYPFFSPQTHSVTGSFEIYSTHDSYETIPVEGNISLLVGDRYLELGQASIKSNYTRKIDSNQSASTVNISFTAFARLGAGISPTRWAYYLANLNPSSIFNIYTYLTNYLNTSNTPELQPLLDYARGKLP
jgi:hypothetical protein